MSKRSARVAENESAQEIAKSKIKSATSGDFGLVWKENFNMYALSSPEIAASTKIAAFDMDHTLVQPKNPKSKFPANRGDWVWWNEKVPEKLKELKQGGFNIVIFTNQGGIEKNKQNKSDITGKILDLASTLGFPIQAFVAAAEDHYRKPFTSMWDEFIENYNGGIQADVNLSFYCGDAAGRTAEWKKGVKKDFSAGDRQFAFNIGLPFKTPEHLFLEEKETDKWSWECFDPSSTLVNTEQPLQTKDVISKHQEMVIMVGRPASGKSTFTQKHFVPNGYIRVNRDTLGTAAKCKKAVELAFGEGKSVVVDNTNPSSSGRSEYILLAQAAQVPVRCFYFETSVDLANHLNFVRVKQSGGSVRRIPPVGYHTYNKNFDEPEVSEGFSEVRTVKFVPQVDEAAYKKIFLCKNPKFGK